MSYEIIDHPLTGVEARPGAGHYGVYDQGAHVWAWQPDGQLPVLWTGEDTQYEPGQPIRGGVPLVFPWFAAGREGHLKPFHGFARVNPWNRCYVDDSIGTDGRLVVEYQLDRTKIAPQSDFPQAYVANLRVLFTPEFLQIELRVSNTGGEAFTYEEALHTYFAVGDVRRISLHGLSGAEYLDRAAGARQLECVQVGCVEVASETDRLYMHDGTVELVDPVWNRQVRISKENSANTVVWNPWVDKAAALPDFGDEDWTGMICVEAANVLGDAITLAPGESHVLSQQISLVALPEPS